MKLINFSSSTEKQTRYLSQAIQLEEAVNPHIIRATMSMISLAIMVFLVWAGFTSISEVAKTPGEIVPDGYQQTVQHLNGGTVKEILIREGQRVKKGEPLLILSKAGIKEDIKRAYKKQQSLLMQEERLRAFIDNRQPDFSRFTNASQEVIEDQKSFFAGMSQARKEESTILGQQVKEKRQTINSLQTELSIARQNYTIAKDVYDRRRQLAEKGYASEIQLLETQQRVNDLQGEMQRLSNQIAIARTAIDEYENRSTSLNARHRDESLEKLSQTEAEIAQNSEILNKLLDEYEKLTIRSPAEGMVKGLTVNTVGSVIQPGQTVMEIVPVNQNLKVLVKIAPQDIGHIEIGQPVQVKFSSYDFSRYGFVPGKLEQVSATTFSGESGERYYQGMISLQKTYVGDNPDNLVIPGMTIMADIITGEKTILQYLLKPIHRSLQTAFTER